MADASDDDLTTPLIGRTDAARDTDIYENYTVDDNGNVHDTGTLNHPGAVRLRRRILRLRTHLSPGNFVQSSGAELHVHGPRRYRRFLHRAHGARDEPPYWTHRSTKRSAHDTARYWPCGLGNQWSGDGAARSCGDRDASVSGAYLYKAPDHTLLGQGFDAGQTVTMSYPGGADLGPLLPIHTSWWIRISPSPRHGSQQVVVPARNSISNSRTCTTLPS